MQPDVRKQLNIDECLAAMEPEVKIAEVIFSVAQFYRDRGNPKVIPLRILEAEPWGCFIPKLVLDGVLIQWGVSESRIELELAPAYRLWIQPEEILARLRQDMDKVRDKVRVIDDYLRRYKHNPGVEEALRGVRRHIVECPDLTTYLSETRGMPVWGWARKAADVQWPDLVMWVRSTEDPVKIRQRLTELVIPFKGKTTRLNVTKRDAWALAQARSVRDIEFILDRLPIWEVDLGNSEGGAE